MVISKLFGQRCMRCGKKRTRSDFEGVPTCEQCELTIAADREENRPCPVCEIAMEKSIVRNVIVDKCPACHGAWLDGGELDVLKKAIDGGASSQFATGMVLGMAMG